MRKLTRWTKKIEEVSNSVWKVTLIHDYGSIVEKTGDNIDKLENELEEWAIKMEEEINRKLKKSK